jgi:ionotropic glutamate receptor NMDA 2B
MKLFEIDNRIILFDFSRELNAFLYDGVVLDYLSGQDDGCKLRVVGNWYAMTGYGLGFPKQSKFKDMINKEIIEMHHSGEIERLRRFWFTGIKYTYF